ncbi:hypothetical protein CesoFtcFv8_004387 [Champsocephalus esox]|uniref:Uncharacterized protein n=1 Tax=Champsocephalus esox TaxID=159716 RepID=A0AAN8CYT9_9TELE|nr:hypothetical protein CesoFtcFv8_004387 [Champsocephalus esox]
MGPKKTQSAEEVDEIKKSLDFLAGEISAVRLQKKGTLDLVEEVKILQIQNAEKDKRLEYLENRVEDLEQYTRINDVIITGLKVKPRSYARAVGADAGGEPGELDASSTEQQVAAFSPRGYNWIAITSRHVTRYPGGRTVTIRLSY